MRLSFLLISALLPLSVSGADVVVVDGGGVVTITGAAPAAPASGEIKMGAGQLRVGGTAADALQVTGGIAVGNATVSRSAPAAGAEVVRGDDPRLSNARPANGGDAATVGGKAATDFIATTARGAPNGVASLDASGKVPTSQLPDGGAVRSADTDWINVGSMTISAVTTAPAKGTVDVDRVLWRREGDSARIRYEFRQSTAGGAGSGQYLIALPAGLVADTAKIGANTDSSIHYAMRHRIGGGQISLGTTSIGHVDAVLYDSTKFRVLAWDDDATSSGNWWSATWYNLNTASGTIAFACEVLVPISGWTQNDLVSAVGVPASKVLFVKTSATQALTGGTTDVIFGTVDQNDFGSEYNSSTGVWTVGTAGVYQISTTLNHGTNAVAPRVFVNGAAVAQFSSGGTAGVTSGGTVMLRLAAGDTVGIRATNSGTLNGSALTNWMSIARIGS